MDAIITDIANYVVTKKNWREETLQTSILALFDSLACALLALKEEEAYALLGPFTEGTETIRGSRVIGSSLLLDPISATFNNGLLIRWLDFNDTWLAKEWGHPSDNFGALITVADFMKEITLGDVLDAAIKAYEIQGVLALTNSMNEKGIDHVYFVKIATAALTSFLLMKNREAVIDALSHAICDLAPLRTYRHAPSTGKRKSWAAADAASRAVQLSFLVKKGIGRIPFPLSNPKWGFNNRLFPLTLEKSLDSFVMDHVLFKVKYPAEFHAQTAVEAAVFLHPICTSKMDKIEKISIRTHASALRIIDKKGPLFNFADRDHCLQYMVAVALLKGGLQASDYHPPTSDDARIEYLRGKMEVVEEERFSRDYLDLDKRSIANAIQIYFTDGTKTDPVVVEYPLGHANRRKESLSHLMEKFSRSYQHHFPNRDLTPLFDLLHQPNNFLHLPFFDFFKHFVL